MGLQEVEDVTLIRHAYVSDCLGRSSWSWCAPWRAVPEHGVEDDQQLAHGGSQRELLGFAGGEQTLGS
jgi:hypothetical protein